MPPYKAGGAHKIVAFRQRLKSKLVDKLQCIDKILSGGIVKIDLHVFDKSCFKGHQMQKLSSCCQHIKLTAIVGGGTNLIF